MLTVIGWIVGILVFVVVGVLLVYCFFRIGGQRK